MFILDGLWLSNYEISDILDPIFSNNIVLTTFRNIIKF